MKKFIKGIQIVSGICLVAFPTYLANEGELGVNLTSILAISSPGTLLIVTGIYDVFRYILPAKTVMNFIEAIKEKLTPEQYEEAVSIINDVSPQQIVDGVNDLTKLVKDIPEILAILRLTLASKLELGIFDESNLKAEAEKHL